MRETMPLPPITVVVLNTNRRDDTLACLGSLAASTYPRLQVMVLDNSSTDGSTDAIRAQFPAVQVVPLAENLGYAGNNNVGLRLALEQGAEWVFVLNEDTWVAPDCLTRLLTAAQADPRIGVAGPMVHTFETGEISSAGGIVDWARADAVNVGMGERDQGQYPSRAVDFINGCGLLISRPALQAAGVLDATFFIYWEETDWCARVKRAGFTLWFEASALMRHKAPIRHEAFGPSTLYYATRNRLRFFARHAPWPAKAGICAKAFIGAVRGIWKHRQAGRREHARATQWALWHALTRRWGKADARLWRSDASDRTLQSSSRPTAPSA